MGLKEEEERRKKKKEERRKKKERRRTCSKFSKDSENIFNSDVIDIKMLIV